MFPVWLHPFEKSLELSQQKQDLIVKKYKSGKEKFLEHFKDNIQQSASEENRAQQ